MSYIDPLPGANKVWTDEQEVTLQVAAWDNQSTFVRESTVLSLIEDVPKGRILDLGCGSARWRDFADPRVYVDVDDSYFMITEARRRFPEDTFHNVRIEDYVPTKKFDLVLLVDVVFHSEAPEKLLDIVLGNIGARADYMVFTYYAHDYNEKQYLDFGSPYGIVVRSVEEKAMNEVIFQHKWESFACEDIDDPAHRNKNLMLRIEVLRRKIKRRRRKKRA